MEPMWKHVVLEEMWCCSYVNPSVRTFADNYFSNFRMVEELIKQGFHYVGTIRGN